MRPAAAAVWVLLVVAPAPGTEKADEASAGPVLLLPGGKAPDRLRLDVVVDGNPPAVAWDTFLDRLFDFFDRDGNGSLGRAEVGRMFPLPLPGRKPLTLDFAGLDADRDGKASRAELTAFCRGNGFGPVVAILEPPSADDLRVSELLSGRLDADADGKLTKPELARATELLRTFDLNEDEFLDLAELLASARSAPRAGEPRVRLTRAGAEEVPVLRVELGTGAKAPSVVAGRNGPEPFRLAVASSSDGLHRLRGSEDGWSAVFRAVWTVPDVVSAGAFLVAQFRAAAGDREALSKADLEQDLTLSGLGGLFPFADRNGDDRLSLSELETYLKLVELGVRSQVWIKVTERGRDPFVFLDADGDGRLSYRELARASDLVNGDRVAVSGLPWQFQFSFGGPSVPSWGGVQVPAKGRGQGRKGTDAPLSPRWFRAMDRNNDGVVSPGEFLGPPEVFRELDADGDGVVSADEARRRG